MSDNWRQDCPARAVGLHHAHWSDCKPTAFHPGTERSHTFTQCCHCERYIVGAPQESSTEEVILDPPMQDHTYVPTMAGLCLRCRLGLAKHPVAPVKVSAAPTTTDAPVEAGYPQIGAQGPDWGPGRGPLTARQEKFLLAWLGWYRFNGGQ